MADPSPELTMVAELRHDTPPITPGAVDDARRLLYAEINDVPDKARRSRVRPTVRPWVWRTSAVTGLTVALAAGITVAQNVGGGPATPGPGGHTRQVGILPGALPAAAEVALRARTAAQAGPDVPLAPGTWTYIRELIRESDGGAITGGSKRTTLEVWFTADGTRRAARDDKGRLRQERYAPYQEPTAAFLLKAATDPAGLRAAVYAEAGRIKKGFGLARAQRDGVIFGLAGIDTFQRLDIVAYQLIAQVLRTFYVTPRTQAGLYGVLATIPGLEVVPNVPDAMGRRGTGFAITDSQGIRTELIVDPQTFQYLGSRSLFVRNWKEKPPGKGVEGDYDPARPLSFAKGTVIGWSAKQSAAVVSGPGDRP